MVNKNKISIHGHRPPTIIGEGRDRESFSPYPTKKKKVQLFARIFYMDNPHSIVSMEPL